MTVHGNSEVWSHLRRTNPKVAFLHGPKGVGKLKGASEHAANVVGESNVRIITDATVEDLREAQAWAEELYYEDTIVVIEMGDASLNAWRVLKSVLEDNRTSRIWVITNPGQVPTPSILTLGWRFNFHMLTKDEMEDFLSTQGTLNLRAAAEAGSVDAAVGLENAMKVQPAVSNWLRACDTADIDLLMDATHNWGEKHHTLLLSELEAQANGDTVMDAYRVKRLPRASILAAITLLHDSNHLQNSSTATALSLMTKI